MGGGIGGLRVLRIGHGLFAKQLASFRPERDAIDRKTIRVGKPARTTLSRHARIH